MQKITPSSDRLTSHDDVCGATPYDKATTLTAAQVADLAKTYTSWAALIRDYPQLDERSIEQCLAYHSFDPINRIAYASPTMLGRLLDVDAI